VNTDSGKSGKSVHDETGMGVHDGPELVFTMDQNGCSGWAGICTQPTTYFNERCTM